MYGDDMKWNWRLAQFSDIDAIMILCEDNFGFEITGIFTPDHNRFKKHLMLTITEQAFNPLSVQLIVAEIDGVVVAYSWLTRNNWMTYAPEEVAEVLFCHLSLSLSPRVRINLIKEAIQQWELWSKICRIPVLVSSTIRNDQTAFLRLHERAGFQIRGSMAFKKIT
jgi:hypothetical protein